jgi:hypothetical protein
MAIVSFLQMRNVTVGTLLTCLCVFLISCSHPGPEVLAYPVAETDKTSILYMQLETDCSQQRANMGVLIVSWSADRARLEKQRIDITVHKGGFDRPLFVTLWPIEMGARSIAIDSSLLPRKFQSSALDLEVVRLQAGAKDTAVSVVLDGLQPGLNYFSRILTLSGKTWVPGVTQYLGGPVCFSEMEAEE